MRSSIRVLASATGGFFILGAGCLWLDGARAPLERDTDAPPESRASSPTVAAAERQIASTCYGTVNRGSLSHGVRLPPKGANFQSYSGLGTTLGRTYVHSIVLDIVLDAYARLSKKDPELQFVYGETGLERGGRFRPHRTHQAGTSVDFMTPVRSIDTGAVSVLPTNVTNKWGYGIDFNDQGKWNDVRIDLEAIAVHLDELRRAAGERKIRIAKVVIYPRLRRALQTTSVWSKIASLPFTKNEAWVRHDDHYHVDFAVPCLPFEHGRSILD